MARIRELDGQGLGKAGIAAAAGVSESSVRSVLRPAGAGGGDVPGGAVIPLADGQAAAGEETAGGQRDMLPVLPSGGAGRRTGAGPVGLLGERAAPVFTRGARYPLAGLLWRCPRWRAPGCWSAPGPRTAGCGTGFTGWR